MLALAVNSGVALIVSALIGAGGVISVALVSRKLTSIASDARGANLAVNHVAAGQPTLIQRVNVQGQQIRLDRIWQQEALTTIAGQVGVHLPAPPPELEHEREPNE